LQKIHGELIMDAHVILKIGAVLFGSISLHHTLVSVRIQEGVRQEKGQPIHGNSPMPFTSRQPPKKHPPKNQLQPAAPARPLQSPKKHPPNLVSPIGLRNLDGICFGIAATQVFYAISELHEILSTSGYSGGGTSCGSLSSKLFRAMSAGDKGEADIILKKLLAKLGCTLGAGGDSGVFMENVLVHLTRENPEITQLFQMRVNATSQPILNSFSPEERSEIERSKIPRAWYDREEPIFLRLEGGTSIQGAMENWFCTTDRRYCVVGGRYNVFYSKVREIEALPPYLLVRTPLGCSGSISKTLDFSLHTRNNQPTGYELIAVISHEERSRGGHAVAYVKDGTNWVMFDNQGRQSTHSIQDIKGQGIIFLYRMQ
jgi:hypothetical protein